MMPFAAVGRCRAYATAHKGQEPRTVSRTVTVTVVCILSRGARLSWRGALVLFLYVPGVERAESLSRAWFDSTVWSCSPTL